MNPGTRHRQEKARRGEERSEDPNYLLFQSRGDKEEIRTAKIIRVVHKDSVCAYERRGPMCSVLAEYVGARKSQTASVL